MKLHPRRRLLKAHAPRSSSGHAGGLQTWLPGLGARHQTALWQGPGSLLLTTAKATNHLEPHPHPRQFPPSLETTYEQSPMLMSSRWPSHAPPTPLASSLPKLDL